MKILIVGLVKNQQLQRLQEEGKKRGHQIDGCYTSDLIINASPQKFEVILKNKDITQYQVIYLWAIGKRRWEWYVAAQYLNQHHQTKIVNQKILNPNYLYYLSPASEYLKQFENQLLFPKSSLIFKSNAVNQIINQYSFPVIVKTSSGRQGKGVFKVNTPEELKKVIKNNQNSSPSFIVRELIPNNGDIRIFTVGYKAIGAMKRTPKQGDFRSNISQGGSGSNFDLSKNPQIKDIAEKLSQLTKTEIAGVDIMIHQDTQKPYILEINPGPQFLGLEKYTQTNAAKEIITYFESLTRPPLPSHSLV